MDSFRIFLHTSRQSLPGAIEHDCHKAKLFRSGMDRRVSSPENKWESFMGGEVQSAKSIDRMDWSVQANSRASPI